MDELLEFVPAERLEEFKAKAKDYVKLTDDIALERVSSSQSLRDRVATPVVEAYQRNFAERKLPEILRAEREKVIKELNPEETAERKEIRELREENAARKAKEQALERKEALRAKYKDVDPDLAARLFTLDDTDIDAIIMGVSTYKRQVSDLEQKVKYGKSPPPGGGGSGKLMPVAEFQKLDARARAAFMASGGQLADQ